MKRLILLFGLALSSFLLFEEAQAQDLGLAVSGKVGTLGYGIELTKSITSTINARVGAHYFTFGYVSIVSEEKIELDVDLKLQSLSVLFDWHPFNNGIHLSVGLLHNENEVAFQATPTKNYPFDGTTYTPADLGSVTGIVNFKKVAPYLGIGFGNAVGKGKKMGMVFDFGVIFQDSPNVHLNAIGMIEPTAEQEPLVEENVKDFKFYPIISLGITYKI